MAIQDLLRTLGQRASTGLERMATDERSGLENLGRAFEIAGARLSGDPRRMAFIAQQQENEKRRKEIALEKAKIEQRKSDAQKKLDMLLEEGAMTKEMYELASLDPERYAGVRLQAMEQQRLQDIKTQEIKDQKNNLIDQLVEDGMPEGKARAAVEGISPNYFADDSVTPLSPSQQINSIKLVILQKIQQGIKPEDLPEGEKTIYDEFMKNKTVENIFESLGIDLTGGQPTSTLQIDKIE
tara:strand:- start:1027 stop:1746 length:720 start_codon:yes stop_codon:yes gene_type:complete